MSESVKCWCGCGRDAEETRRRDSREILVIGAFMLLLGLLVAWAQT